MVMAMKSVAPHILVVVVIGAGSVLMAPPAKADISLYCRPGCWGAIAASLSTGEESLRTGYTTQQKAEDAAVMWCDVIGKTNDCQVMISGLG
ncbi:hypothetical protein A5647_18140 [Mycobacterium sp. 1100029.7]|nr:hypothetical protein A5647_18140 [Mycobacterium sp. 1100029.7]